MIGWYIPFDWEKDFEEEYRGEIQYYCLVMSEKYIRTHLQDIKGYANVIERRLEDEYCTVENLLRDNATTLKQCEKYKANYILIDEEYQVDEVVESLKRNN